MSLATTDLFACSNTIIIIEAADTVVESRGTATLHATDSLTLVINNRKRKKLITAIWAFPFPLGFMGAHRVMLGCKPWIPVVYVATFGGCFGLIPLIDFCVILVSKNIEQYENNPNVFMWVK